MHKKNVFHYRNYLTSLKLVFCKAVHEIYPKHEVIFLNSLNNGLYGKIINTEKKHIQADYHKILTRMRKLIEENLEIQIVTQHYEEIKKNFRSSHRKDIQELLETSLWTGMIEVALGDYVDYFYHLPYSSTSQLRSFDVYTYSEGFILKYPLHDPEHIEEKIDTPKMAQVFEESDAWLNRMDISTAGSINKKVLSKEIRSLIRIQEALHHKNLAKIAEKIAENKLIKLVTIAGPSSSGKTTFANRLYIQLRAEGLQPLVISLDNYYIGRKHVPLNERGEKDYEALAALDIKLLNENLVDLIAGKEVELPLYNFVTGERETEGKKAHLDTQDGIIIIEGIHGLNEAMTQYIPREQKFKIYISCLTQVNLDYHNRIASSDVRELRRMVRDSLSRNTSAEETLKMWADVRAGEEKHIFPYQEEADVIFNSSLAYEIGVLRDSALKELVKIQMTSPYYEDAKRLIGLISCFLPIDSSEVPDDSILKEFIGRSFFYNY